MYRISYLVYGILESMLLAQMRKSVYVGQGLVMSSIMWDVAISQGRSRNGPNFIIYYDLLSGKV